MKHEKSKSINCLELFFIGVLISCFSCTVQNTKHPFTHGNVQLSIKKGETTQAEILEKFGPPNVATIDSSGKEVWVYQKHATISKSSQSNTYWTLILLGGIGGNSGFEQSSRTMTLILKFDKTKRVADFNSMTTSF